MTSDDIENLGRAVKESAWSAVLNLYEKKKELRTVDVTCAGDTALHVALSKENNSVVESMVDIVCKPEETNNEQASFVNENGDECKLVLGAQNAKGDTPLHLAASLGNTPICRRISKADFSLIVKPNFAGETPLFKAASHGKKDTFLRLHYLYMDIPQRSPTCAAHYKRFDGDTILHRAIAEEDIDLAIEIVLLYKNDLAEMIKPNDKGLTPLRSCNPFGFQEH